jgi:hypothetical protein
VIKVYENFDFSRVGQMQSLLESHGIGTFIRNQYGSSVMGEVPFVEVVPQLYVLRERDVDRAIELLQLDLPRDNEAVSTWKANSAAAGSAAWAGTRSKFRRLPGNLAAVPVQESAAVRGAGVLNDPYYSVRCLSRRVEPAGFDIALEWP